MSLLVIPRLLEADRLLQAPSSQAFMEPSELWCHTPELAHTTCLFIL